MGTIKTQVFICQDELNTVGDQNVNEYSSGWITNPDKLVNCC